MRNYDKIYTDLTQEELERARSVVQEEVVYAKTHPDSYVSLELTEVDTLGALLLALGQLDSADPNGKHLRKEAKRWADVLLWVPPIGLHSWR